MIHREAGDIKVNILTSIILLLLCCSFGIELEQSGCLYADVLNRYPLDSQYHRPEDILRSLWELVDTKPDFVSWEIIGESSNEKLPIYAFRITNSLTGSEHLKPSLLFHGQHHSEEPIGVEIIFYMSNHFLAEYGKDRFITYLIDNYNLWFIPTINPEGFRIVNLGYNRLKRKNNTDTNMNGFLEIGKDGVDLNRNYPFNWEEDENTDPESPYFKGFEPASQSEIWAMMDFFADKRFQLAFFYHSSISGSYSERIFFPWRWNEDLSPDYDEMFYLASTLASYLPRLYTRGNYTVHQYSTSRTGFARDYIYSQHGTLAMLIEAGGNSPYGEGVINPSNEILLKIQRDHTRAVIRLLQEYNKNLLLGKVIDKYEFPVENQEIILNDKQNPGKKNLLTNRRGNFFYYLMPSESPINLTIDSVEFSIYKEDDQRIEFSFYLDKEVEQPFFKGKLNNGEAIIMTNPVFQYFPPLVGRSYDDPVCLTISDEFRILHRQEIRKGVDFYEIPWIPADLTKNGLLTLQRRDLSPYGIDHNNKLSNKILFLTDEQEVLTYATEYNPLNTWYLHPETMLGLDYGLYPAGDNDYYFEQVRIHGSSLFRSDNIELILYAGAEKIYQTRIFRTHKDYISFSIPKIALPEDLFLVIANRGYQSHSIYRERALIGSSERMYVHYSGWMKLEGKDLAVEILLTK